VKFLLKIRFYLKSFPNILFSLYKTAKIYRRDEYSDKLIRVLDNNAIGALAYYGHLYINYIKNNYDSLNRDVVFISKRVSANEQLMKMISRVVTVVFDDEFFEGINSGGIAYLLFKRRYLVIPELDYIFRNVVVVDALTKTVEFTPDEVVYGESLLKKIGLNMGQPFVVITNKDSYYWLNKRSKEKPWDLYRASNFDITNEGINYLNDHGYQVVRGGDYGDVKNNNYITINNLNKEEKDFIDIYLQYKCVFSANAQTGTWALPLLFKKPSAGFNWIGEPVYIDKGLFILKKLKNNGKTLRYSKMLDLCKIVTKSEAYKHGKFMVVKDCVDTFRSQTHYDRCEIEIIDNNSNEFFELMKEMVLLIHNKLEYDKELQDDFKGILPIKYPYKDQNGIISPHFLKNNVEMFT